MPTLLEKIESSAAKQLKPLLHHGSGEVLSRCKKFLKVETHRLKILHRAGGGGRDICKARTAIMDQLLGYLWDVGQSKVEPEVLRRNALAVVATGGYGREELNPCSDIDIMFLHEGTLAAGNKPVPEVAALVNELLYTLWDIGLKVGQSVRGIPDCVKIANADPRSKTSLIEARLVTGDQSLFERFQKTMLAKCVKGCEEAYIASRIEDQNARRERFGNSIVLQEPNIKNGCGGLRDFQNLLWMAFFKYRTATLTDLAEKELIAQSECKQLETAYDFLLRVRNELHYHADRPLDVLLKTLQPAVAYQLGYTERSPRKRLERFMGDLYLNLRQVFLITRTVEQRLALLPGQEGLPSWRHIIRNHRDRLRQQTLDGFKLVRDEVRPGSGHVFSDRPRRMMRLFLHMQQRGLRLHPDLIQLLRNQLFLVNRSFLHDASVKETFLEILNQPGNVAPILRAMHEAGFLGKYLPEFGKLTCLVQHEFYHQYTADEHTLVCLEKLDEVWEAKAPPYSHYTEMLRHVENPFVLYLALLLHDAGKAYPDEDHCARGAQIALKVAKRLDLPPGKAQSLRLIIENHLAMAQISQRRDLDDPVVIRNFANLVQTPENLEMLTLHTFADSTATSSHLWNDFKDSLLRTLCAKTMHMLVGGTEFIQAGQKQREQLADQVRRLKPSGISEEELEAHFQALPPRYFTVRGPREIVADLVRAHHFMRRQLSEVKEEALAPVVNWRNAPNRGYTSVYICTWDRAGLFSKIAGSLTTAGLNILSAQVFTRSDGIIFDTFFVTDAHTGRLAKPEERSTFQAILAKSLTTEVNFRALLAPQKGTRPAYRPLENERLPINISFDNELSEDYTIIDIETEDRVGLLFVISRALTALGLEIALAKISTGKGEATDSFYVVHPSAGKVIDEEHQRKIERRLRNAIRSLDKI